VVVAVYLAGRAWQLASLGPPIVAAADSAMYRGPAQRWLQFNDVSFTGAALRPWPVTLLYALVPSDEWRVLAQFAIATVSWAFCIWQVARLGIRPAAALLGAVVVAVFALTAGVSSWDAVILSESLSISMAALLVGAVIALARWPFSVPGLIAAGSAALALALIRPPLIALLVVVALVPAVAWLRPRRGSSPPRRPAVVALTATLLMALSAVYVIWYSAQSDLEWGRLSGVPGQNGRTLQQYSVIVNASPVGAELVKGVGAAGAPPCLLNDYQQASQSPFPERLKDGCEAGLDWVSHQFFRSLAIHLASHPSIARRYFAPALVEESLLRADGVASLATPVPAALSDVFFVEHPRLGDPLLLWVLGALALVALSRGTGFAQPARIGPGPSLMVGAIGGLLAGFAGLFGTAFLSPVDVSRVGLPCTVVIRLSLIVLIAVQFSRSATAGDATSDTRSRSAMSPQPPALD
jgi:hypothetical protein